MEKVQFEQPSGRKHQPGMFLRTKRSASTMAFQSWRFAGSGSFARERTS
ncbi:MAG: hypothetical protein ACI4ET_06995 [Bilifractor sp.]